MKNILLTVATIALLSSCATSPTGRSQVTLFPESQMSQMGSAAFTSMKKSEQLKWSKNSDFGVAIIGSI